MGGDNRKLHHLKVCGDCSQAYSPLFAHVGKYTSCAFWASDSDTGVFIVNRHRKLRCISEFYWGAIIAACAQQLSEWGVSMEEILALCDDETRDRLNGGKGDDGRMDGQGRCCERGVLQPLRYGVY